MSYKKNILLTVLVFMSLLLFLIAAIYCLPRMSLLSSSVVSATVNSADSDGSSGFAILKVDIPREDGGTLFFHYYYPSSTSNLKNGSQVFVAGNITFMDQSTEPGVNSELVIGTRTPVLVSLIVSLAGLIVVIVLLPVVIRNFRQKPWNATEEMKTRDKLVGLLYTAEIFALAIAMLMFIMSVSKVGRYLTYENHSTGTVTYQSSRQSSQFVKNHSHGKYYGLESTYGKGIRPVYSVFQIKAETIINGDEEFWYEGNNLVFGSKKVYIGYDDSGVALLSSFEAAIACISGGFLLLHAAIALIFSKKNKYGGKVLWFFKF